MTRDNNLLGNIEVNGIRRLPREPQVEFMLDANGILQVGVLNKATSIHIGIMERLTITNDM